MGKTFVYNQAVEDPEPVEYMDLSFGMFFDGTLNNRRNSEIRQKILEGTATPEEKELYDKNSARGTLDKIFNNPANNSYVNDYSNVARQSLCCLQKYAIYIEGIGTEDEKEDSNPGFMLGSGKTGIRGKVRKGCEELVERIIEIKKDDKILRSLTLDVLGFSRGAAAARNFVYEVNVKQAYSAEKTEYTTGNRHLPNNAPRHITDFKDSDGKLIDESILEDNLLPARGHLGYKLLESGLFSQEELENLTLTIRFLGVYDTVSSYAEVGDGEVVSVLKGSQGYLMDIFNNVEELQLNNLGPIKKAVHFTAMDEHRENFSLTKLNINGAIEKAFPGVHSDVGGGYESGVETVDEVETSNNISNVELEKYRKKLIAHYWWTDKELILQREHKLLGNIFRYVKHLIPGGATVHDTINYNKLKGTRTLKKEYSYIPLHYMNTYYGNTLEKDKQKSKVFIRDITEAYSITKDTNLVQAKKILYDYVVTHANTKKWEFIPDEELEAEHEKKVKKKIDEANKKYWDNLEKKRKELEQIEKDKSFEQRMREMELEKTRQKSDNTNIDGYKQRAGIEYKKQKIEDILNGKPNEAAIRKANPLVKSTEQKTLRILRHQYLHWSATRDWIGMDPVTSRKRKIY